ncbi:tyrosine-type recombinase/integrase [Photobacterium damselae]|uniref:tyrosine-type recombinase/integrase n=1 Tax=Photobacterium damselae TaxID=38293 RepID=UPI0025436E77
MLSSRTKIRINQQAFFSSTLPVKISDAQIKRHIDDLRVRQLKDIRCPLYLRFNQNRTGGTWWFYRYEKGKQYSHRLGAYPAIQAKDIMDVVSAASVKVAKEEIIECHRFETVDQLVAWHVERQRTLNQSSKARLVNLKSMAETHVMSIFHGVGVTDLTHQELDRLMIQPMFSEGYSVSYVRANFFLLKTAYSTAKRLKHISINPLADIQFKHFFPETFSITEAQIKGCRLSTEQLVRCLPLIAQALPPKRLLLTMILAHGSRIGETRKARWKNINLSERSWFIPKEDSKNGVAMVYPLTTDMVELLRSYQVWQHHLGYKGDLLFPLSRWSKHPIHSSKASEWVREISDRQWSAHDLRKRARSIWAELGIDYIIGESLLNHSRDKLDQAYIHTHMELQKKEALETYHNWLKNCWCACLSPVSIQK